MEGDGPSGTEGSYAWISINSAVLEIISNPLISAFVQLNYGTMQSTAEDSHSSKKRRCLEKERTGDI